MKKVIDKNSNIAELLQENPDLNDTLYEYGLYCGNCFAAGFDNLEEGAKVHGLEDDEIEELIQELNKKSNDGNKEKVVVGMSGGVDSSVAALLLKEQGYEVIGVTLKVWKDDQKEAIEDAKKVADALGIEHRVLDVKENFKCKVVDYFTNEYLSGKTPNPCVVCNKEIKFGDLLRYALGIGANFVATGHYARIEKDGDRFLLKKSKSLSKDQTYPLYHLTQKQLAHVILPLADYEKSEVREIAKKAGLKVADKGDSQDICFVKNNDYAGFIEQETGVKAKAGDFVDQTKKILGKHSGVYHYTIGQRKGLGIAVGKPIFVSKIDTNTNEITLGDEENILSKSLIAEDINFIPFDKLEKPLKVKAKIRYGNKEAEATISPLKDGKVRVDFVEPQRAITTGQSVVFYQDDLVVGGGVIC